MRAVTVELFNHLASLSKETILKMTQSPLKQKKLEYSEEELEDYVLTNAEVTINYNSIDISNFLPESLKFLLCSPEKYSQQLEKIRSNHKALLDQHKDIWTYEQALIFKMKDDNVDNIDNIREEDAFLKLEIELQKIQALKEEHKGITNSLKMSADNSMPQSSVVQLTIATKVDQKNSAVSEKKVESEKVSDKEVIIMHAQGLEKKLNQESKLKAEQVVSYTVKEVNTSSFYDEILIMKVWDTYLHKKEFRYYCGSGTLGAIDGRVASLFTGNGMLLSINAGILINKDGALYKRNNEGTLESRSISICSLVNHRSGTTPGYNAITSNLNLAINQIVLWNTNPSNEKINSHLILFPYHKNENHWNLGIMNLNFQDGILKNANIIAYDPYGSGKITETVFGEIRKMLTEIFSTMVPFENISNEAHKKQQNDGSSCGVIVSEDGKDFIDGANNRLKNFYREAISARLHHLNEVKNPIFYQRQWDDRRYEDHSLGDKEIKNKEEVINKLLGFINKLEMKEGVKFKEAFSILAEVCKQGKGRFVQRLNYLRERELNDSLTEDEQNEIAKFSVSGVYVKYQLEILIIDPSMCAVRKLKSLFLEYKEQFLAIKIDETNLFNLFFKEDLSFQNGAVTLLDDIAKGNIVSKMSEDYGKSKENGKPILDPKIKSEIQIIYKLLSYPSFASAFFNVEARIEKDSLIVESSKNNVEWLKERLTAELLDNKAGLGKYIAQDTLEFILNKFLETKLADGITCKLSIGNTELGILLSAVDQYYISFKDSWSSISVESLGFSQNETLAPVLYSENYSSKKRHDLLPGFSGSLYQGDAAIHFMLEGLENNKHFDIRTEVVDCGKWDDFKIIYANRATKKITGITFVQCKHGYEEDSYLLPANFYNKSGKAQLTVNGELLVSNTEVFTLPMYFDDWLEFVYNPINHSSEYVVEFILFSNRIPNEKVPGFQSCFDPKTKKLTDDFIKETGNYAKTVDSTEAEKYQKEFRKKLFDSLSKNSEYFKKHAFTDVQKIELIKRFLNSVVFKLGEEHLDEMEESNKNMIRKMYPHTNSDSIYHAFRSSIHQWLRTTKDATSLTDEVVREMLNSSSKQYLILGEEIGATHAKLKRVAKKMRVCITRDTMLQKFSENCVIALKEKSSIFILSGPEQSGKTSLLFQYYCEQIKKDSLIFGEFLYFKAIDKLKNSLQTEGTKLIVLDNVDKLLENEQNFLLLQECRALAVKKNKHLILVVNDKSLLRLQACLKTEVEAQNHFVLGYLTEEEIKKNLDSCFLTDSSFYIGRKKFSWKDALVYFPEIFKKPENFVKILSQEPSILEPPNLIFDCSDLNSSHYVPLDVIPHNPIYSLRMMLQSQQSFNCLLEINALNLLEVGEKIKSLHHAILCISAKELISEYEKDRFDFDKFLKSQSNKSKDQSQLLAVMMDESVEKFSQNLIELIKKQSRLIVFGKDISEYSNFFALHLACSEIEEADIFFESKNVLNIDFAKPIKYRAKNEKLTEESILRNIKKLSIPVVLEGNMGAGKTTLANKIESDWLEKGEVGNFLWVCKIRLNEIRPKDDKKKLLNLIVGNLEKQQDKKATGWQIDFIKLALDHKKLFLIADSWDEMKELTREKCANILREIFEYPKLLVTTRPNDRISLPLANYDYLSLRPFDEDKIREFIGKFFIVPEFSKTVYAYLSKKQNQNMLGLIGVPMTCYLLCTALKPYYEKWLENSTVEMPWVNDEPLSKIKLFQLFMTANLTGYLIKHEKMLSVGRVDRRIFPASPSQNGT